MAKQKNLYCTNEDLLREIHESKLTYCSDPLPGKEKAVTHYFDIIVPEHEEITKEVIEEARKYRAQRLYEVKKQKLKEAGFSDEEILSQITLKPVSEDQIVIRKMTSEHCSDTPNFPPFKHYMFKNGKPIEVLRSHWKGSIEKGVFCCDHGRITDELGRMYLLIGKRYSQQSRWHGYSYLQEMISCGVLHLCEKGLKFNEAASHTPNPFAYFTSIIWSKFLEYHKQQEKKLKKIKDEIRMHQGQMPSYSRMIEHEMENNDE